MSYDIKWYGWVPDLPDARDHLYAAPVAIVRKLPPKVDLRPKCPPPYDQDQLGSCTGNAIAGAIQFERKKQGLKPNFVPSRLFIYYNERVIERTVDSDNGAQIRDGIKTVSKQGVCPETDWPYTISKFAEKPTKKCYEDALKDRAVLYSRLVQDPTHSRAVSPAAIRSFSALPSTRASRAMPWKRPARCRCRARRKRFSAATP